MKYKIAGALMALVLIGAFAIAISSYVSAEERQKPVIEGSLTYDPVTVHADVVDLAELEEIDVYFRYREEGRKGWTKTDERTMSSEGTYSKIITDIDSDENYEFQVVVEWIGEEDLIFETEKNPAEFKFSNLRVDPEKVYVDDQTNLKLDVENVGGQTGETTVDFEVSDKTVISETVEVEAGETKTVSASYVPKESGKYHVEAGNATTSFEAHDLPSVEAKYAESVTDNSAVLVAELTNIGLEDSVDVYFRYRNGDGEWVETDRQEMTSEGEFSQEVRDLGIDTEYRFRAVVEWDDRYKVGEAQFKETKDIEVRPNAVTDEKLRGVNDIGVFFWGEGVSLGGDITEYRWDFDGDGEWDYVDEETGRTLHVYEEPGVYTALFEIEDDRGKVDSQEVEVTVKERTEPLYKIEETADGVSRDVYFSTEYLYDEDEDETRIAVNVKNSADEKRKVNLTMDIPEDVAQSMDEVMTFPGPTEVIEENPKFSWVFEMDEGQIGRVEMSFDGHIEAGRFDEMKMIQAYGEDEMERRTVTGLLIRGVRRVWGFIVIIIVAIFIVLLLASDRGREKASVVFKKFEQTFLVEEEKNERKVSRKKELDKEFFETTRRVKEALKRDEITNPHNVVCNLEKANDALENGNFGRFRQHLGEVENEMKCGVFSNNVVS
ncbi:MAG: PKD domain-containing protein [Candidatus Aenigmatarchaeota archaeon]